MFYPDLCCLSAYLFNTTDILILSELFTPEQVMFCKPYVPCPKKSLFGGFSKVEDKLAKLLANL